MMTRDIKDLVLVCNTETSSESTCPESSTGGRVGIRVDVAKRSGQVGSSRVNRVYGLIESRVKTCHFKQVNRVTGRVWLTRIFQQKKKIQLQKQINDNLFRENE